MDVQIELRPEPSAAVTAFQEITWPTRGKSTEHLRSDMPWSLHPFDQADVRARDLARIAVGAFCADLSRAKPSVSLHRSIELAVHVESPSHWSDEAIRTLVDLLHWLTGDTWTLHLLKATVVAGTPIQSEMITADRVQLLSGGLDSLCGAIIASREPATTLFLGHSDTSKAIKHAQSVIQPAFHGGAAYRRFEIHPEGVGARRNHGPRSRSFMFMALAVLAASACGGHDVVVPENGFTSINPPLDPSRGGPLTTRSTHPWTFDRVKRLLELLGLGEIEVRNPHAGQTKGELLQQALPDPKSVRKWKTIVGESLSCAKFNGQVFPGGSANLNCGLCVACVVRRASFRGANMKDPTEYLVHRLTDRAREQLVDVRRSDIAAIRHATKTGVDENAILASAVWPDATDFDEVMDICDRGLKELALVRLPS